LSELIIKSYLWFIIIIYVLSALGRIVLYFKTDKVSKIDLIESGFGIINSIGLYGYLYEYYFFNNFFWYFIIAANIGFGVYNLVSKKTKKVTEKIGLKKTIFIMSIMYFITAPQLYFLIVYARSII